MILTIGITSYNRIAELSRCINSIQTKYVDDVQIIVSEDKSPKRDEIRKIVGKIASESKIKILFNTNEKNLGYDRNLMKLASLSNSDYLMYLSDDDVLVGHYLDDLIDLLRTKKTGVVYTGFSVGPNDYRRFYKRSFDIPKGDQFVKKHIQDSILFSGLCFNLCVFENVDGERFLNKNYIQLYLFMKAIFTMGGYFLSVPLIDAVGDGENAYGISESSEKKELLANRKNPLSMLEFHNGSIAVVKMFDRDFGTSMFNGYAREYNLRSITGMTIARSFGLTVLRQFWKKMNQLDIPINLISKTYYIMLLLFGARITTLILNAPKKILKLLRNEN